MLRKTFVMHWINSVQNKHTEITIVYSITLIKISTILLFVWNGLPVLMEPLGWQQQPSVINILSMKGMFFDI